MVKMEHLKKNPGDLEVLKGISLTVEEEEKPVIIGPSGSGESTLIRCTNYLEEPTPGKATVSGTGVVRRNHPGMAKKCSSMIFRQFNLYLHLTVVENLTLTPMRLQHIPREQTIADAMKCLERVGLKDRVGSYPVQLSGRQQQRVAIARALCTKQPLTLFDEPAPALDPEMVREALSVVMELVGENITTVCVTREVGFTRQMTDWMIFMDGGYTLEEGMSEHFFEAPEHEYTKAFLSRILH